MIVKMGDLAKGKEYKVKFEWTTRAVTKTYTGDRYKLDYDEKEYPHGIAIFEGRGGIVFAPYEKIVSIAEASPKKAKQKTVKTCTRCNGIGILEHLKHVDNGYCFKCRGTGWI